MDTFSLESVSTPNLSLPGISWNGNLSNVIQLLKKREDEDEDEDEDEECEDVDEDED